MTFSSDGYLLAASIYLEDGIEIWDIATGEILRHISKHYTLESLRPARTLAVVFSPDDARLAATLEPGTVLTYDVHTGTHLETFHDFFEGLSYDSRISRQHLQAELRMHIFNDESSINAPPNQHISISRNIFSTFTICEEGTWILRGQQRVLWLPPEYRPIRIASYDGFVILGCRRGIILRFQFAVDALDKVLV
jgi:WD40 repeat protein